MEAPGDQPCVKLNPLSDPVPLHRFISDNPTIGELYIGYSQFVKISIASLLKSCNCAEGGDELEMLHLSHTISSS